MKLYQGTVISTAMAKTAKVEVTLQSMHPLYKKTVKTTKKYLVHDETEQAKVGDSVTFTDSRPMSKNKRFSLVSIKQ